MKRILTAILICLSIVLLLTACGHDQKETETDTPEKAANEWMQSLLELNGITLSKRTCTVKQSEIQSQTFWLSGLVGLSRYVARQSVDLEVDTSDVHMNLRCKTRFRALVGVSGTVRSAVLGVVSQSQINTNFAMVWESERWKWCGEIADTSLWSCESPRLDAPLTQAYYSPDGTFGFRYPQGWTLNTDEEVPILVNDDRAWAWFMSRVPEPDVVVVIVVDPFTAAQLDPSGNLSDLSAFARNLASSLTQEMDDPALGTWNTAEITIAGRRAVTLYVDAAQSNVSMEMLIFVVEVGDSAVSMIGAFAPRGQMKQVEATITGMAETLIYDTTGIPQVDDPSPADSENRQNGSSPGAVVVPTVTTDGGSSEAQDKPDNLLEELHRSMMKQTRKWADDIDARDTLEKYYSWLDSGDRWVVEKLPFFIDLLEFFGKIPIAGGLYRFWADHSFSCSLLVIIVLVWGQAISDPDKAARAAKRETPTGGTSAQAK